MKRGVFMNNENKAILPVLKRNALSSFVKSSGEELSEVFLPELQEHDIIRVFTGKNWCYLFEIIDPNYSWVYGYRLYLQYFNNKLMPIKVHEYFGEIFLCPTIRKSEHILRPNLLILSAIPATRITFLPAEFAQRLKS